MRRLLERLLDSSGADRAFVVHRTRAGHTPRVEAVCSRRGDGAAQPSSTAVHLALRGPRPVRCADVAADRLLADGISVRGLALRSVFTASMGPRRALLLDSRRRLWLESGEAAELTEAYAGLAAAILDETAPRPVAQAPDAPLPGRDDAPFVAGDSPAMDRMLHWIRRIAGSELPVLIRGETGSGKELAAREVHRSSARAGGPFLAVNCTAFTDTLLDAELFGAFRGAYTGADSHRQGLFRQAGGGTLFLDEVGDMPPAMQAKLLRAIQERRIRPVGADRELAVDVRIVSATHRDLRAEIAAGRFRQDLYFRLAMVEVRVPPLRERLDDLRLLVSRMAPRLARDTGCSAPRLAACAWQALSSHRWPGNVRELHAVLARAMLRRPGGEIRATDLELAPPPAARPPTEEGGVPLERSMIEQAVRESGGRISGAAQRIGWSRQKLYRRMRALGLRS